MALSEAERRSILLRDEFKCQFPACPERGGTNKINCTPDKLNVHHILPQRYSEKFDVDPDFAQNLITICQGCHIGSPDGVHPDTYKARFEFRGDNESFKAMADVRNEKLRRRLPCWNTQYDRAMSITAVRNTQKAESEGWVFLKKEIYGRKAEEE